MIQVFGVFHLSFLFWDFCLVFRGAEAIFKKNDPSAMVFSFILVFFMYMPANNQIAQAPDSYFSFIFWLVVWVFQKNGSFVFNLKASN